MEELRIFQVRLSQKYQIYEVLSCKIPQATYKRKQQLPTLLAPTMLGVSCCVRVGSGVQMDETTPNNVETAVHPREKSGYSR